ncbi:hypothetical protein V6N13_088585 [Hibiscus sabdariffa]|uniref:Uncharacterized protein n=1 Tax=Hibiscus sabdariffa TaxID=183260 RepID=A0ABR2FZY6_9ROSI
MLWTIALKTLACHVEDQRVAKKGRNCASDEIALVEQGTGQHTVSYASVTAKGSIVDEGPGSEDYLDPDAAIILDEDCVF